MFRVFRRFFRKVTLRLFIRRKIDRFLPSNFSEHHPVRRLFESSMLRAGHVSGSDAVTASLAYLESLRVKGTSERLTAIQYLERLKIIILWTENVFNNFPHVDCLVFFGSALRGKCAPNDFDFSLILPASDVSLIARTEESFKELASHFHSIEGRPVKVRVVDSYNERPHLSLSFVERCPYAVFARSIHGKLALFANFSGRKYLEDREP
jgi:hypothetical protein